jgi:hypothetical protein
MWCTDSVLVKEHSTGAQAATLRCRSWTCEFCGPNRRRQLVALARSGHPDKFITLTASPQAGDSPVQRAKALARAWRVILARAKRLWKGKKWEYLAVFEATKRGEPHLHIIARCPFVPQRWLSEQAKDIVKSPIVDIRAVKSERQVAAYVTKYIGKDPHRFGTCKRYWHSAHWSQTDPEEPEYDHSEREGWRRSTDSLTRWWNTWHREGHHPYEIEDLVVGWSVERDALFAAGRIEEAERWRPP